MSQSDVLMRRERREKRQVERLFIMSAGGLDLGRPGSHS